MISRRRFVLAAAGLPLAVSTAARAQADAIRLVVGFPPGGVADVTARALVEGLRPLVGSAIIVDNRSGAGGRIAIEAVKGAAPDGRTLLYCPPSMFTLYPHVEKALRYDPFADFAPLGTVCTFPFGLAVAPNLPVKTLAEFVAWAKANPKEAMFGSPGRGNIQSFVGAMLARAAGITLTEVPYKGGAQSIIDVMAGTIASSISVAQLFTANHKAGKLRVLAISAKQRLASLPEVPTFAEQGFAALTFEERFGVFAPARTPPEVVSRLAKSVRDAVDSPAVRELLAKLDYAPQTNDPAALARILREEHARWGAIVKETGFTAS